MYAGTLLNMLLCRELIKLVHRQSVSCLEIDSINRGWSGTSFDSAAVTACARRQCHVHNNIDVAGIVAGTVT